MPFSRAASQEIVPSTPAQSIIDTARRVSSRDISNEIYSVFVLCGDQDVVEFPSATRLAVEDIASEPKLEVSNSRLLALVRSTWPNDCSSLAQPRLHEQLHQLVAQYAALVEYVRSALEQLKQYVSDKKLFSARLFELGHRRASNVLFAIRESLQNHLHNNDAIENIVPDELSLLPLNHLMDTLARFPLMASASNETGT